MTILGVTAEHGNGLNVNHEGLDEMYGAAVRGEMDSILIKSMIRLGRAIPNTEDYERPA